MNIRYFVINTDINLRCGKQEGYETFKEALQVKRRLMEDRPEGRYAIKDDAKVK